MSVIQINGQDIAVAMSWRALLGVASERTEVASIAKEIGALYGVTVSNDSIAVVGFTDSKKKAASGGAWLAAAMPGENVILVEEIEQDVYWMCVLRDGAPMAGHDIICKGISELRFRLKDGLEGGNSRVYSLVENLHPEQILKGFQQLVHGTPPVMVTQIAGISRSKLLLGVAILGLIVVWYVGDKLWQDQKRRVAQNEMARIAALNQENDRANHDRARQDALAQSQREVETTILAQSSPKDVVSQWREVIYFMPGYPAGWKLSRINCNLMVCQFVYMRTPLGTMELFHSFAAGQAWKDIQMAPDLATVSIAITLPNKRAGNVGSLPDTRFYESLVSRLQRIALTGVTFTLGKAEVKPVTYQPSKDEKAVTISDIPWKTGVFTVNGKQLFELMDLTFYINDPNVAFIRADLDLAQQTWKVDGVYVSK